MRQAKRSSRSFTQGSGSLRWSGIFSKGLRENLSRTRRKEKVESPTGGSALRRSAYCLVLAARRCITRSWVSRPEAHAPFKDGQFLEDPSVRARQIVRYLRHMGHRVNRKRMERLMRKMGLEAVGRTLSTRSIPICFVTWTSPSQVSSGAPMTRTFRCGWTYDVCT